MNPLAYEHMQEEVRLIASAIASLDPIILQEFVDAAERANSVGPILDPTAHRLAGDKLQMVIEHAKAVAQARALITKSLPIDVGHNNDRGSR